MSRGIATRFTKAFGLDHPVVQAPMAFVAGGALAQAIQAGGGLGLIGQGIENEDWLHEQFKIAKNLQLQQHQGQEDAGKNVGIGFICWVLAEAPQLLEAALEHRPSVFWFSFGNATPFIRRVRQFAAETQGSLPLSFYLHGMNDEMN